MNPIPLYRLLTSVLLVLAGIAGTAFIFNHYNPWLAFAVLPVVCLGLYFLLRRR